MPTKAFLLLGSLVAAVSLASSPTKFSSSSPSSPSSPYSDWDAASSTADLLQHVSDPSVVVSLYASIGNGYFATTMYSTDLYVANVYNGPANGELAVSHAAKIPSPFNTRLTFRRGVSSSDDDVVPASTREALDVRGAKFLKRYDLSSDSDSSSSVGAVVQETWAAHRSLYHTMIYRIEVLDGSVSPIEVCFNSQPSPPSIIWRSDDLKIDVKSDGWSSSYPGTTFMNATTLVSETDGVPLNTVAVVVDDLPECVTLSSSSSSSSSGSSTFYEYIFSIDVTASGAQSHYDEIKAMSSPERWSRHEEAWNEIWSSSIDFFAAGEDEEEPHVLQSDALYLAQVTNSSLYYLYSSLSATLPHSIAPGTLSSNDYNQHIFWDAPTWMLPTLSLFHPDVASMMLQYYVDRMDGAREKAKDNGYLGLMFPWESAQTGIETCPTWAPTGVYEQHISSDVVIAASAVYFQTRDAQFLAQVACPLARGVSDFWVSRVTVRDGSYHIDNVIPPDEYASGVNDSVYTNAAATRTLSFAADFCCDDDDEGADDDADKCANYRKVADGMYLPYDSEKDFHPEYEGYVDQTAKQADVTLLKYPLEVSMSDTTFKNDLTFYSTHTDEAGPAMTWGSFAIGHLSLGEEDEAKALFRKSYETYAKTPFLVWTETPTGGASNFATGMGGFLQVLSHGFVGLRVRSDGIDASVKLPSDFDGLCGMRLRGMKLFGGAMVDVEANECGSDKAMNVTIEVTKEGKGGDVCLRDTEYGARTLEIGKKVNVGRVFTLMQCDKLL